MFDVTVVLLDEGICSTAITPVEVFHSAGTLWQELLGRPPEPAFNVRVVSPTGAPVMTAHRLLIHTHGSMQDVERTDIVVIATSGTDFDVKLARNAAILPWLKKQHAQGAYVAGVCAGVVYLAEAGLLDRRIATSHWAICDALAERYPKVRWRPDLFVTEDMRVLCSGGVYASADVSLYLVAKLCGHDIALECARALLLPMPRACQSGYAMLPVSKPHNDEKIRAVEEYLQTNLAEDLPTPLLAARAGMGVRTFVRHFKAATGRLPGAYLQALRIAAAKTRLETSAVPVQSISQEVGYADVVFFRSLFKRATGMTPAEYRAHFAPLGVSGQAELA